MKKFRSPIGMLDNRLGTMKHQLRIGSPIGCRLTNQTQSMWTLSGRTFGEVLHFGDYTYTYEQEI